MNHGCPRRARPLLLIGAVLALAAILAPAAQARTEGFENLTPTPVSVTSLAGNPSTGILYAQENEGTKFFSYDPRTNAWTELAPAPVTSGNNGGAAYLGGKIYAAYTRNSAELSVYDIASGTWSTIANPLGKGTGDITAGDGKLFMAVDQSFISYDPTTGITTQLANPPAMEAECNEGFEEWGGLQFTGAKIYGHQGDGCRGFAVYDIASNSWTELPLVPLVAGEEEEGPVLGSAWDPVTRTYFAYGPYSGHIVYRFDADSGTWSTTALPFTRIDDGGMVYLAVPGLEGVYMIQGEGGPEFARYSERLQTDVATSMTASVESSATGGTINYSISVANNGPDKATGVSLSDPLPAGTTLVSAASAQGSCAGTSKVTCGFGVLAAGANAKVTIKVNAPAGVFTNTATASTESLDTNRANDSATVVTTVTALPKAQGPVCRVPKKLRSRSLKGARKALVKNHCKPGKVSRHHGDKITKGRVIRGSKRKSRMLPAGTKINLTVSLGRKQH